MVLISDDLAAPSAPSCSALPLAVPIPVLALPAFDRPLQPAVREIGMQMRPPWVRTIGKLSMQVTTQGWRFPTPGEPPTKLKIFDPDRPAPPRQPPP